MGMHSMTNPTRGRASKIINIEGAPEPMPYQAKLKPAIPMPMHISAESSSYPGAESLDDMKVPKDTVTIKTGSLDQKLRE